MNEKFKKDYFVKATLSLFVALLITSLLTGRNSFGSRNDLILIAVLVVINAVIQLSMNLYARKHKKE